MSIVAMGYPLLYDRRVEATLKHAALTGSKPEVIVAERPFQVLFLKTLPHWAALQDDPRCRDVGAGTEPRA